MSYKFEYVVNKLKKGNVRFDISHNGEDSAAIILPDYNRILGVWPDTNKPCPFWINGKFLESPNDKSVVWLNPGGHRMWIAPEREFFISDLNAPFDTYKVPRQIDPGQHEYEHENNIYSFFSRIDLYAYNSKVKVPLSYKRNISFFGNKEISKVINLNCNDFKCVAYQDDIILKTETDFKAGIWLLIQVPLDGQIYLPLNENGSYKEFFGNSEGHIQIEDSVLNIKLNPIKDDFKIGLIASSIKDRIAYIRQFENKTILVLKIFDKGNDAEYIDTPWQQSNVAGSAAQIFCGGNWGFAELEVHTPVTRDGSHYRSHFKSRIFIIDISSSTSADAVLKNLETTR